MLKTSGQIADEVLCALYKMAAPPAAPAAAPMSFPKAPAPIGPGSGQAAASQVLNRPKQTGPNPAQAAQLQRRGR
jgi:hypothetical protein